MNRALRFRHRVMVVLLVLVLPLLVAAALVARRSIPTMPVLPAALNEPGAGVR